MLVFNIEDGLKLAMADETNELDELENGVDQNRNELEEFENVQRQASKTSGDAGNFASSIISDNIEFADQNNGSDHDYRSNEGSNDGDSRE